MPKRKQKKYSRPKKLFDKTRILEENDLKEKYGLKNKKEIWKADAAIGRIRNLAKELITKSDEEKQAFIERLQKKGFNVENIADVLGLNKEDWLKRRLQTILHTKGLCNTPKQSRQLVVHKHVAIGNQLVNIPSYMVTLEEEPLVELKITLKTPEKGKSKMDKIAEDIKAEGEAKEAKETEDFVEGTAAPESAEKAEEAPTEAKEEAPTEAKEEAVTEAIDKSEDKSAPQGVPSKEGKEAKE